MKFYLLSDNVDTLMGMRLAGIDGIVIHQKDEVLSCLDKAMNNKDVAVVLITEKLMDLCKKEIYDIKLKCRSPLIVAISDRHGNSEIGRTISGYVNEAIGLKM